MQGKAGKVNWVFILQYTFQQLLGVSVQDIKFVSPYGVDSISLWLACHVFCLARFMKKDFKVADRFRVFLNYCCKNPKLTTL